MNRIRLIIQPVDREDNSTKEPVGYLMIDEDMTLSKIRPQVDALLFHKSSALGDEKRKYNFFYEAAKKNNNCVYVQITKQQEDDEKAKDFAPVLQVRIDKKVKKQEQIEEETDQGFIVDKELVGLCDGSQATRTYILLQPNENPRSAQIHMKLKSLLRDSFMYDAEPRIPMELLFTHLDSIQKFAAVSAYMRKLVAVVEECKAVEIEKMRNLRNDGDITFDFLQHLYTPGAKIVTTRKGVEEQVIGGTVMTCRLIKSFFGSYVEVCYKVIRTNGKKFFSSKERACINGFNGARRIADLPVRPLEAKEEAKLTERGRKCAKYGIGAHYKAYSGNLLKESWCGPSFLKAHGRVMIDAVSYQRNNPNSRMAEEAEDASDNAGIEEDHLFMCWPTLLGFSFTAKKWGEIDLNFTEDIQFDDLAFDRLVLAPEKKQLVQGLVQNYQTSFSDIISGKGGGCIFLLHGQPGTGKTLTAEAIAELLHRPLYSVTVGELGTSTSELEKSLREILEVASAWNAVVLLDEADIFLEKRTENDITRNAMVGIFLRLLEYHQGVLFLTTNRVKSFDSAFHSRISVALRYPDLGREERRKVCENLLAAAGIEGVDVEELSEWELNGRQIKTTIRLAQSLALNQGVPISTEHIRQTVGIAQQFKDDLA